MEDPTEDHLGEILKEAQENAPPPTVESDAATMERMKKLGYME